MTILDESRWDTLKYRISTKFKKRSVYFAAFEISWISEY